MDTVPISNDRLTEERSFRRRLTAVLGTCLVVGAGGLLADFAIARHGGMVVEARARLAALVAEQSLVVHRLALAAAEMREGGEAAPPLHRTRVADLAEELDRNRRILADGHAGAGLPPAPEWARAFLFSAPHHLDRRLADLVQAARDLAVGEAEEAPQASEVIERSQQVLTGLDFLGRLSEDAAGDIRVVWEQLALALRLTLMGVLAGIGVRVLRPLVAEICNRLEQLARARDEAMDAARHDRLTGLPTREELVIRLDRRLADRASTGQFHGIVTIDFAGLQAAIHALDEGASEAALHEIARRLRAGGGPEDMVARGDGASFILVLVDLLDERELAEACGRLLETLAEPVQVGRGELLPGPLLGACSAIGGGAMAEAVMDEARIALTAARQRGAGAAEIFTPASRELHEHRRNRLLGQTEPAARLALVPIVSLASGRVEGVLASASKATPVDMDRAGTRSRHRRAAEAGAFADPVQRKFADGPPEPVTPAVRRSAFSVLAGWRARSLAPRLFLVPVSVIELGGSRAADALLFEIDGAGLAPADVTFLLSLGKAARLEPAVSTNIFRLAESGTGFALDLAADDPLPPVGGVFAPTLRCLRLRGGGGGQRAIVAFARAAGLEPIGGALATEAGIDAARAAGFVLGDGLAVGAPMAEDALARRLSVKGVVPTAIGGPSGKGNVMDRDAG